MPYFLHLWLVLVIACLICDTFTTWLIILYRHIVVNGDITKVLLQVQSVVYQVVDQMS